MPLFFWSNIHIHVYQYALINSHTIQTKQEYIFISHYGLSRQDWILKVVGLNIQPEGMRLKNKIIQSENSQLYLWEDNPPASPGYRK